MRALASSLPLWPAINAVWGAMMFLVVTIAVGVLAVWIYDHGRHGE